MTRKYLTVWYCQDCAIAECNGDYSGMSDEVQAEVQSGAGRMAEQGHVAANFDSNTGDGLAEFSWRPCDCCGSVLGGYRVRFALFPHSEIAS